jgi:hypothetical protein
VKIAGDDSPLAALCIAVQLRKTRDSLLDEIEELKREPRLLNSNKMMRLKSKEKWRRCAGAKKLRDLAQEIDAEYFRLDGATGRPPTRLPFLAVTSDHNFDRFPFLLRYTRDISCYISCVTIEQV